MCLQNVAAKEKTRVLRGDVRRSPRYLDKKINSFTTPKYQLLKFTMLCGDPEVFSFKYCENIYKT